MLYLALTKITDGDATQHRRFFVRRLSTQLKMSSSKRMRVIPSQASCGCRMGNRRGCGDSGTVLDRTNAPIHRKLHLAL